MTSVAKRYAAPWLEQSMRQAASLASVPGLSADAVLCVRHLSARIDTHALRHGGGLLNTASRVSRQLQILASAARRPAHEVVPENAEAVLFDDPAEMLACAARDWLDGHFPVLAITNVASSAARTIGTQLGRAILRGILGSMTKR